MMLSKMTETIGEGFVLLAMISNQLLDPAPHDFCNILKQYRHPNYYHHKLTNVMMQRLFI